VRAEGAAATATLVVTMPKGVAKSSAGSKSVIRRASKIIRAATAPIAARGGADHPLRAKLSCMSNVANPYQPPEEDDALVGREPGAGDFRVVNGDTLVAEKGAVLPAICLWNGEPCSAGRRETNFAWAPSWTLIFIVSPLLYVLVYLLVRKRGRLSYCLGTEAQGRRKQALMLAVGAPLGGVALGLSGQL
jgi:hypothetical protein